MNSLYFDPEIKIENLNFYSEILNLVKDGFVVLDQDGKIIYCNQAATTLLGLSNLANLKNTPFENLVHFLKEDGSAYQTLEYPTVLASQQNQMQKDVTVGIRNEGSETKWLCATAIPFRGNFENEKASVLLSLSDVCEQVKKTKMITGIVSNSPGMIYQFKMRKDGTMYFPFVSHKAYDIYELNVEDFEKDPSIMLKMVFADDQSGLTNAILKSAENLEPFNWKGRIRTKTGQLKWIRAKSIPQKEENGEVLWDGIVIDITKEVRLQEELSNERLKAAHSSKLASLGELSAGVAHEINNPLTVISGLCGLLQNAASDPILLADRVDKINKAVSRITKIVNGLKRFARADSQSKKEVFYLEAIVKEAISLVEIKAKQALVQIILNIKSNPKIICDAIEIEQVIINIINNAIDAVENITEKHEEKSTDRNTNKWVEVDLFEEEKMAVLRVKDSGPGISKEIEDKLFDPFFTTKEVGKGTGLGLSIARGIIKDHAGEISLLKDTKNTCFEIRIPTAKF